MSTIAATNLKNASSVSNNIVLNVDGTTEINTVVATNLKNPSSGSNNIVLNSDGTTTLGTAKITSIADSSGANISTPAAIASGICKAWVNFNGDSNTANLSGTYSQSGTTVTVTATSHGLIAGNTVYSDITSGTAVDGSYTVATVTNANTFTYTAGTSLTTSGNVTIRRNTIRASYNVSSITDNGTGDYTVNFTTALADANYAAVVSNSNLATNPTFAYCANPYEFNTGNVKIKTYNGISSLGLYDASLATVAIFR